MPFTRSASAALFKVRVALRSHSAHAISIPTKGTNGTFRLQTTKKEITGAATTTSARNWADRADATENTTSTYRSRLVDFRAKYEPGHGEALVGLQFAAGTAIFHRSPRYLLPSRQGRVPRRRVQGSARDV